MIQLDASPSAAWWVACTGGHRIRIRALTSAEVRAALLAAAAEAPADHYGLMVAARVNDAHLARLDKLRTIATEAAVEADRVAGESPADAVELVTLAQRALANMETEAREGRARIASALADTDPEASRALARWHAHLAAPHLHTAARAIVEWPGRLDGSHTVEQALDALGPQAGDSMGLDGVRLAADIVAELDRRALGERGKERSAPPQSSRGGAKTERRGSAKPDGTAAPARKRG